MLMMTFHGPHFIVEDTEIPKAKSFVQDPTIIKKKRGVVIFYLVCHLLLESMCWWFVDFLLTKSLCCCYCLKVCIVG